MPFIPTQGYSDEVRAIILQGYGLAGADRVIDGQGFKGGEPFGSGSVIPSVREIYGYGIPTMEALGAGSFAVVIVGHGIHSSEVFGSHATINKGVIFDTGIPTREAFGHGVVAPGPYTIDGRGIATAEALGLGILVFGGQVIQGAAIHTREAFGYGTVALASTNTVGTPFIVVHNGTDKLSDAALAAVAGVDVDTIRHFRTSLPSWKIERAYKKVAAAIGCDPNHLLAQITGAKNKVYGRAAGTFPSAPGFGNKLNN